jgi:hypothetical protein
MTMTREQVAHTFGVSRSCVQKLLRRWRETGNAAPRPHGGGRLRTSASLATDLSGRNGRLGRETPEIGSNSCRLTRPISTRSNCVGPRSRLLFEQPKHELLRLWWRLSNWLCTLSPSMMLKPGLSIAAIVYMHKENALVHLGVNKPIA